MSAHAFSVFLTSAAASLVEFIEALTVVLAVGVSRGWKSSLAGAASAALFLALSTAAFGPALLAVPARPAQAVFGTLLVLFGMRWLRKATRRAAGLIPLRDEMAAFARHRARLGIPAERPGWDAAGFAASFQATTIEGLEVIFVVVAMAAGGVALLGPAVLGAAAAFLLVVAIGAVLHRPISHVPENTLKRAVGVLLCAFGTYWIGEGFDMAWPGGDFTLPVLVAGYAAATLGMAAWIGRKAAA